MGGFKTIREESLPHWTLLELMTEANLRLRAIGKRAESTAHYDTIENWACQTWVVVEELCRRLEAKS